MYDKLHFAPPTVNKVFSLREIFWGNPHGMTVPDFDNATPEIFFKFRQNIIKTP